MNVALIDMVTSALIGAFTPGRDCLPDVFQKSRLRRRTSILIPGSGRIEPR
jgi:hypothetical protein